MSKQLSKQLSYLLRHAPQEAGLQLEAGGWVSLELVLKHLGMSREQVEQVVENCPKQRFSIQNDRIRANQGHSVSVDLELLSQLPPPCLYHGTNPIALAAIRREGVRSMNRHHVHLSADRQTAAQVGKRRGRPVVLNIQASKMEQAGYLFYCSANGVWLTEQVPLQYIVFPE